MSHAFKGFPAAWMTETRLGRQLLPLMVEPGGRALSSQCCPRSIDEDISPMSQALGVRWPRNFLWSWFTWPWASVVVHSRARFVATAGLVPAIDFFFFTFLFLFFLECLSFYLNVFFIPTNIIFALIIVEQGWSNSINSPVKNNIKLQKIIHDRLDKEQIKQIGIFKRSKESNPEDKLQELRTQS
jgi:hypothetical protein